MIGWIGPRQLTCVSVSRRCEVRGSCHASIVDSEERKPEAENGSLKKELDRHYCTDIPTTRRSLLTVVLATGLMS